MLDSLRQSALVLALQSRAGMKQASPFRAGWLAVLLAVGGGCESSTLNPVATGRGGGSAGATAGGSGGGAGGAVGGSAGAAVGGSGGSAVNACPPASPVYPRLGLGSIGSSPAAYDGPAIVERSVGSELILAYDGPAPGGAGGGAAAAGGSGGAAGTLQHVRVSGLEMEPTFPPGARVWLSKGQDPSGGFVPPQPRSFAIRSGQGGTLLMGAALNAFNPPSSPVTLGPLTNVCTATSSDSCLAPGSTVTYSEVTINGDSPVVVRDGAVGEAALGGVRYDVRMKAQVPHEATGQSRCADYFPFSGVSLDVRAKDLAALAAGLTVGSGPACGQGNDPRMDVSIGLYEVDLPSAFEGPVTYRGLDSFQEGAFAFDIPGRPPLSTGDPARLYIAHAASVLTEPAIGQQFWLSWMSRALLESQGGPVVFAQAGGSTPAGAITPLATALGVGVTLEKACSYGASSDLWRARFATTPAVVVASGTIAPLTIGGRNYRAWMWSESGGYTLTVVRGN